MDYPHKYIVCDFEGLPLKKFRSKKEAEWFIANKQDCSLMKDPLSATKTGKRISKFEQALKLVGECRF